MMSRFLFRSIVLVWWMWSTSIVHTQEIITPEVKANEAYLGKHSIHLYNGEIPFVKNEKWGIRDKYGKVLLQPIYDELYNLTTNFFVAKNEHSSKMFDETLWSFFDSTVVEIKNSKVYNEIEVIDIKGELSIYQIITLPGDNYGSVSISLKPKEGPNHFVAKPIKVYSRPKQIDGNTTNFTSVYLTEYCDSIVTKRDLTKSTTELTFYKGNQKYGALSGKIHLKYVEDSLFCYYNFGANFDKEFHVLHLRDLSEILTLTGEDMEMLNSDNQHFFSVKTDVNHTVLYNVFDLKGKLILVSTNRVSPYLGVYRSFVYDNREYFDLYSFPQNELLLSNVKESSNQYCNYDYFELYQQEGSNKLFLFQGSNLIHEFSGKKTVVGNYSCKSYKNNVGLISCLEGRTNMVFSSKGMCFQVEKGLVISEIYYDDESGIIRLQASERRSEKEFIYAVYDDKLDSLTRIPTVLAETNNLMILGGNSLLNFEEDEQYHNRIFIQDLNGSCLDETVYSEIEYVSVSNEYFVQLQNENQIKIIKPNQEVICENCYLNENIDELDFFVLNREPQQPYFEILDANLKPVFNEQFLAVDYWKLGQYFIVLDVKRQIRYIPRSETNLPELKNE